MTPGELVLGAVEEESLGRWLLERRWFGSKARDVANVHILDTVERIGVEVGYEYLQRAEVVLACGENDSEIADAVRECGSTAARIIAIKLEDKPRNAIEKSVRPKDLSGELLVLPHPEQQREECEFRGELVELCGMKADI